jgi:hypothetical protein
MAGMRERYGDSTLHAVSVVVSFAIATYAFTEIARRPGVLSFAVFFAGAIVAHDLFAFPVYSLLDALAGRTGGVARSAVNYVRVPALLAGFALVVWFPLILGLSDSVYVSNAGHEPPEYLQRWLLLTAALFAISGAVYAVRRRARGRGLPRDPRGPHSRR